MRVMNHSWSAMKQRLHPQSVAEISCHSVLSGTGFDNVGHRLGLATRTQITVCKLPFPSAEVMDNDSGNDDRYELRSV